MGVESWCVDASQMHTHENDLKLLENSIKFEIFFFSLRCRAESWPEAMGNMKVTIECVTNVDARPQKHRTQ